LILILHPANPAFRAVHFALFAIFRGYFFRAACHLSHGVASKSSVVSGMPYAGWTLAEEEIRNTITAFENA
jgi:hypothetical protein